MRAPRNEFTFDAIKKLLKNNYCKLVNFNKSNKISQVIPSRGEKIVLTPDINRSHGAIVIPSIKGYRVVLVTSDKNTPIIGGSPCIRLDCNTDKENSYIWTDLTLQDLSGQRRLAVKPWPNQWLSYKDFISTSVYNNSLIEEISFKYKGNALLEKLPNNLLFSYDKLNENQFLIKHQNHLLKNYKDLCTINLVETGLRKSNINQNGFI